MKPIRSPQLPGELLEDWQSIVDLIVRMTGVKVGLVMQVVEEDIAVLVASRTANNPYHVGEREHLDGSGLYCETVIKRGQHLLVPDALKDPDWDKNPDLKFGLVSYLGFPIRLPDGGILGTLCVLDDKENHYSPEIVSLMSKMQALIESQLSLFEENRQHRLFAKESLFRRILDSVPVALACCNFTGEGPLLYLNQQFSKMLGYSIADISSLTQLLQLAWADGEEPGIDHAAWQAGLARLQQQPGFPEQREIRLRCRDGDWCDVLLGAVLIEDLLIITLVDISERKQAEALLRERERRLDQVLTAAGLGFWEWDIRTGGVLFDERALAMVGRTPETALASYEHWRKNVHPDDADAVFASLQDHLDGNTASFEVEYRLRHLEGHWLWVLDRGKVVARDRTGQPLRITGTSQDISHRKQLENESAHLLRQITSLLHETFNQRGERVTASPARDESALASLTRRQKEVLRLVASGLTSAEIARQLNISTDTVDTHRRDLMRKLDIRSVAGLTKVAIEEGLL